MSPQTSQSTTWPHLGPSDPDLKCHRGQLQHRCGFCAKTNVNLSRCSACRAVRYCGKEHQAQHRSQHKTDCNHIKKLRAGLDKEEKAIRNATPGFLTPANAFETHVGALHEQGTLDGVSEALDHVQDMLRLDRDDNIGLGILVPSVMLQLDKDQECYDFVKWWVTVGRLGGYESGNVDLPFLNVKGANVLEDVKYLESKRVPFQYVPFQYVPFQYVPFQYVPFQYVPFQYVSAVMLLNLKLLVDVVNIRLTRRVLRGRLPRELWASVESNVVRSPISHEWIAKGEHHLTSIQKTLQVHVKTLAEIVSTIDRNLIEEFLNAEKHVSETIELYKHVTIDEVVQHCYLVWWQHEGVLELLQSAKMIAGKDGAAEIDDVKHGSGSKNNTEPEKSKAKLLDDISCNWLWDCFDDAVEDAVSLNKIRPSDKKREEYRELRAWVAAQLAEEEANDNEDSDLDSDDSAFDGEDGDADGEGSDADGEGSDADSEGSDLDSDSE